MKKLFLLNIGLSLFLLSGLTGYTQQLKTLEKINPIGLNEPSDLLYFKNTWYACGNKAFVYESKDLIHWEALPNRW